MDGRWTGSPVSGPRVHAHGGETWKQIARRLRKSMRIFEVATIARLVIPAAAPAQIAILAAVRRLNSCTTFQLDEEQRYGRAR